MTEIHFPYEQRIEDAAGLIKHVNHFVAFTGAGISTESGLPDYRGPDGVWTRREKGLPPKPIGKKWSDMEPNKAHIALVELQNMGLLKFMISQNVDNLHLKSGIHPDRIAEYHGNTTLMKCMACDQRFQKDEIWDEKKWGKGYRTSEEIPGSPRCECGGRIISSVINFGDPIPDIEFSQSIYHAQKADVFLVVGSSLKVTPAADLPVEALDNGAKLIIINMMETPLDDQADVRFYEGAGQVLTAIVDNVRR